MAKSDAQRAAELRERRAARDLHEVRGIWAPKAYHVAIRLHVSAALTKPTNPDDAQRAVDALEDALRSWFKR